MPAVLDAFKIKQLDLEPIFAEWKDGPILHGKPKKDLPVDEWLQKIKEGCQERHIPRDYWHKVGYHFMGTGAKGRLDEVKKVMRNMHGGKYKWNWKTFKVAMRNMGWDIDPKKTEEFEVQSKPSGLWWIVGRRRTEDNSSASSDVASSTSNAEPTRPSPKKSKSMWEVSASTFKGFPSPKRSVTSNFIETVSSASSSNTTTTTSSSTSLFRRNSKSSNKSSAASTPALTPGTTAVSTPSNTPGETTTTITQAPLWLVNACQALDFITTEHPKVMTALSAILITVGSIPALPAISAGAGGAFLASGTAHALGSIAVGLGGWLRAASDGQVQTANGNAQAQGQGQNGGK